MRVSAHWQAGFSITDMPDETAATIDADGWLYMGDLATMDERGFLRITGRLKDMIIRGGLNIYPREIEELLFQHQDVAEVAIVGVPDEKWGEQIGAVVRPTDPANPPDAAELKAWCRDRIAAHKTPSLWYFTDGLPMTPTGKIQKFRVQREIASGALTATHLDEKMAPERLSNS